MIDAAKVLGEIVGLLGGLGSFLGVFGVAMVLLTLLVLTFVNAISPASRGINLMLSVGVVVVMAMLQAYKGGDVAAQAQRLTPYFVVMAAPYLLAVGVRAVLTRRRSRDDQNRMDRIERLTEELNREVDGLRKWN